MFLDGFRSQLHVSVPRVSQWARPTRRWLVWLVPLFATMLAVGVAVAAADPYWSGTTPMDISHSSLYRSWQPAIAAGSSGLIVVAWSDQQPGGGPQDRDIYYTKFPYDNGYSWSLPVAIAETADMSRLPDVLIVGDRVFVTWCDQVESTAPYTATIREAEIGSGVVRRVPAPFSSVPTRSSVAAGAGMLHVVFAGGTETKVPDVYHAMRPLTATVWPTATVAYTHTALYGSWDPMLAVGPDGKTLHVVWEERASSTQRTIMYMHGVVNDNDVNWTPPALLSPGITLSVWPVIAADSGGNLHVVWGEQVGTGQERRHYMWYRRYAAGGSWSAATRIDPEPVRVNERNPTDSTPSLTLMDRGNQVTVCIAWHGFREGQLAEEVLLSCSRDGGQSWPPPQNMSRSGGAEELSIRPSITFDVWGQLHGVWQEHRESMGNDLVDDYQVYYSHALSKVFLPFVGR